MKLGFSSQKLDIPDENRAEQLQLWRRDCKTAFQLKECEDGERYSAGQTFWLGAHTPPRCELERLAAGIFAQHTKNAQYDPATSGAEWWTQHIDTIDDIGFHFDRDYGLEEEGELCHPHLGTVTYLSDVGGATVILDMPGIHYPTAPADRPASASSTTATATATATGAVSSRRVHCPLSECVLSRPEVGKHITFDGLRLHGAPGDLFEKETDCQEESEEEEEESEDEDSRPPRVTFLVNIWLNHIPTQAVPLHDDLAAAMQEPLVSPTQSSTEAVGATAAAQLRPVTFQAYPAASVRTISLDEEQQQATGSAQAAQAVQVGWGLQLEEEACRISLWLPLASRLEGLFQGEGAHTVIVQQPRDGSAVVTGCASASAAHCSSSSSSSSSSGSSSSSHQVRAVETDRFSNNSDGDDAHLHKRHRVAE